MFNSKSSLCALFVVRIIEWNFSGFAIILLFFNQERAVIVSLSKVLIKLGIELEKLDIV